MQRPELRSPGRRLARGLALALAGARRPGTRDVLPAKIEREGERAGRRGAHAVPNARVEQEEVSAVEADPLAAERERVGLRIEGGRRNVRG